MTEWREDDPRESVMKRASIAICIDRIIVGGTVETKHAWTILLQSTDYHAGVVSADDPWPKGWRWVLLPDTRR